VVDVFERLRVRYLVTGSIATIHYGEPRFTNDIDVVADLPPESVADFCAAFPADDFYVDEASVRDAIARRSQFNIIHPESGLKVDVMIPADSAFNHSRFARAVRVKPESDYEASFASAEDVIIKKLEYFAAGGSDKHLRDITGMLKVSGDDIDCEYIGDWARRLALEPVWTAVRERWKGGSARGPKIP
jgi:hypothetical protein